MFYLIFFAKRIYLILTIFKLDQICNINILVLNASYKNKCKVVFSFSILKAMFQLFILKLSIVTYLN